MSSKSEKENDLNEERNKEVARETWDSWIVDLTDQDQPETCGIDDDDCEACGS